MSSKKKSSPKRRTERPDRDVELGREIARLRKATKCTQDRVATDLKISTNQYGKYERGETPMKVTVYEEIKAHLALHAEGSPGLGFSEERVRYVPPGGHVDAKLLSLIAVVRRALDDVERHLRGG